ncbi:MAG: alpha/beta hydrolase, partial [Hyphomonas sp.]
MRTYDRGGARQVLALHCSLAHGGAWAGVAAGLSGVILAAPDLPGHGAAGLWDGRSDLHGDSTRLVIGQAEAAGQVDLIG